MVEFAEDAVAVQTSHLLDHELKNLLINLMVLTDRRAYLIGRESVRPDRTDDQLWTDFAEGRAPNDRQDDLRLLLNTVVMLVAILRSALERGAEARRDQRLP
jgi:hypothetical protein